MVAEQTGARVVKLPIGADRLPDLTQLPTLLNDKTRLLALGQMSNVTGGCPDLAPAIALAHAAGARVMIDGAQGVVHGPADVQRLDIDFYAFSGHKLYGPTGIGALYGKAELLAQMAPWQGGGKMLTGRRSTVLPRKNRRTASKPARRTSPACWGWPRRSHGSTSRTWRRRSATAASWRTEAEQRLAQLPGFRSFRSSGSSLLAFDIAGVHHSDIVTLLAEQGIALRAGQHCAQPLMAALGVSGTLRASFAPTIRNRTSIRWSAR